ncbi:MAG: type II toxin-antitoxin system VapC family toxin [Burkholderiales bacterium]
MQLVDTNVISELMRPAPNAGVADWSRLAVSTDAEIFVSVITIDEVMYGLTRRPRGAALLLFERFLADTKVLPVTESVARRGGELRALHSLRGHVREQPDMLIAATAQVHALTVVTRNVRDFEGCGIAILNPFSD